MTFCTHPGLIPLGRLGRLAWFRCRHCGMDLSRPAEIDESEWGDGQ